MMPASPRLIASVHQALIILAVICNLQSAMAENYSSVLVGFDFYTPNDTQQVPKATLTAPGMVVSDITRGAGASKSSPSSQYRTNTLCTEFRMASQNILSLETALASQTWCAVQIAASNGFSFTVTNFTLGRSIRSTAATGSPTNFALMSVINNITNTVAISNCVAVMGAAVSTVWKDYSFPITGAAGITNMIFLLPVWDSVKTNTGTVASWMISRDRNTQGGLLDLYIEGLVFTSAVPANVTTAAVRRVIAANNQGKAFVHE